MEVTLLQSQGKYVIRKYINRRLYDLQTSKPTTLNDIANLVMREKDVVILDAEDENISTEILADTLGRTIRIALTLGRLNASEKRVINRLLKEAIMEVNS